MVIFRYESKIELPSHANDTSTNWKNKQCESTFLTSDLPFDSIYSFHFMTAENTKPSSVKTDMWINCLACW